MSMIEMQRVLSKVLTDDDFRQAFADDAQEACGAYTLTAKELGSLKAIDKVRMESYSTLLREGRIGFGLKAFPVTARMLQPVFRRFIPRYVREYPPLPTTGSPLLFEAMSLYRFIARLIGEGSLDVQHLSDVLEYEKTLYFIGNDPKVAARANACAEENSRLPVELAEDVTVRHLKPLKGDHAEVSRFSLNVIELLPLLDAGQAPEVSPPEEETYVLFLKTPHQPGVNISRINKATANLINLCDGRHTTAELIEELAGEAGLESDAGRSEQARRCVGLLSRLLKSNVISFGQ